MIFCSLVGKIRAGVMLHIFVMPLRQVVKMCVFSLYIR